MTGGELAQLITSIATLVGVIGGLVLSYMNRQTIQEVHKATNGMTQQLVQVTAASSRAKGNLEGRAELKQEQKDR